MATSPETVKVVTIQLKRNGKNGAYSVTAKTWFELWEHVRHLYSLTYTDDIDLRTHAGEFIMDDRGRFKNGDWRHLEAWDQGTLYVCLVGEKFRPSCCQDKTKRVGLILARL